MNRRIGDSSIESEQPPDPTPPTRPDVFTLAIVSQADGHTIALFATGARHTGENLERLLVLRECEL